MVQVVSLGAATAGPGPGSLGAQGCDAGQLDLDRGDLLVAAPLVPLGLLGVVADDEPAGRIAAADADLLTRRCSRTLW
jgi:hypothetical protein